MYTRNDNSNDAQIKVLRQQENSIQKQIDSIRNGNGDAKTKKELIEPLQDQIQNIESRIQQLQIDQSSDKSDKNRSLKNIDNKSSKEVKLSEDSIFLSMSSTYDKMKKISFVRKNLKGMANELNSDADLDENMGNYKMAKTERKQASENKSIDALA